MALYSLTQQAVTDRYTLLWELWMFWFQDFSDDVFVFSSFLGAGFTEGSHLFFRSQALPDTNTQKSLLTSGENLCL